MNCIRDIDGRNGKSGGRVFLQALDLSPGYTDSHNIASMDIQGNVEDALDLQFGSGTAGAESKLYVWMEISIKPMESC